MHIVVLAGDRHGSGGLTAALAERLRLPLVNTAQWEAAGGDLGGYPDGFVLDGSGFQLPQLLAVDAALDRRAARIDLALHFTSDESARPLVDHYVGRIVEVDGPIDADAVERALERVREAFAASWHF